MAQWQEEFDMENQKPSYSEVIIGAFRERLISACFDPIWKFLSYAEVFISNMPLTIGAVGLSWVTQGVIWFKFMEENNDSCTTVHFYSAQCTYPEFPGCFECDTSSAIYRVAVTFHYFCHIVAFSCCLLFLAKCVLAWRVVADELSNPTTSTPCGVVCITMICVAAGRGVIGEIVVEITSAFHFFLSLWFLYIAIFKFRLWPDPGWFPNTVGIAYAAIKTWLYFPIPGLILMTVSEINHWSARVLCWDRAMLKCCHPCRTVMYDIFLQHVLHRVSLNKCDANSQFLSLKSHKKILFHSSIYRAFYNHKIAAPVCFISLSAPSITMYAMTIMAQPRPDGEMLFETSPEFATRFDEIHRMLYLPVQHGMMILSLIGFASSLHCLWARWPQFSRKEFSPAHVAFIFPILSHTNAVQAYRAGVDSFSAMPVGSPFKVTLFTYWFTCLVVGTILNFIFTYKYVTRLPKWTKMDAVFSEDEERPPSPSHTIVHGMLEEDGARECLNQNFTSPAVLQANEAGALVRVRRGTEDYENYGPYIRTRQVTALGFDLTMTGEELRRERAELLDWVAKNAPRTRNRTLSIPHMTKLRGGNGDDIYGTFHSGETGESQEEEPGRHQRSNTWGGWF
jgi:hypothetical protein